MSNQLLTIKYYSCFRLRKQKMTSFQDIPVEVLLKIMTYLDRATLLIASSVSRQWESLIHDISWQFLCNSLNSNQDSDLRQQLEFYGWEKESHSAYECRYFLQILQILHRLNPH